MPARGFSSNLTAAQADAKRKMRAGRGVRSGAIEESQQPARPLFLNLTRKPKGLRRARKASNAAACAAKQNLLPEQGNHQEFIRHKEAEPSDRSEIPTAEPSIVTQLRSIVESFALPIETEHTRSVSPNRELLRHKNHQLCILQRRILQEREVQEKTPEEERRENLKLWSNEAAEMEEEIDQLVAQVRLSRTGIARDPKNLPPLREWIPMERLGQPSGDYSEFGMSGPIDCSPLRITGTCAESGQTNETQLRVFNSHPIIAPRRRISTQSYSQEFYGVERSQ